MLEVIGQGDENIGHFFTHLFFENVWNWAVRIHIAKEVDLKTTFISLPCILSNMIGCDHVFADLSGSCGLDSFATLARVHQNIKAILIGAAIETSDDASVWNQRWHLHFYVGNLVSLVLREPLWGHFIVERPSYSQDVSSPCVNMRLSKPVTSHLDQIANSVFIHRLLCNIVVGRIL